MAGHEIIAMILAGGRGTRLYNLTDKVAKPAVSFGGKYRIIDFPLSNCSNSGIDVVGILTQYENIFLNSYVAVGSRWGLDARDSGVYVLPPREKEEGFGLYRGTADALAQNIDFIDSQSPEYVLVLSGDHIYKMDYSWMLKNHQEKNADASIAVLEVPMHEASRFGIMNVDELDNIYEFEEKPAEPKSNLASMGIYIFTWSVLKEALEKDAANPNSHHDFGKDIIPTFLNEGKKLVAYRYKGYWKDVGTIDSLWEAHMDLLNPDSGLVIRDFGWKVYSEDQAYPPHQILNKATVKNSLINQGAIIKGEVINSVISANVVVEEGAVVRDSVIYERSHIKKGAILNRTVVMENLELKKGNYGQEGDTEILLITDEIAKERK